MYHYVSLKKEEHLAKIEAAERAMTLTIPSNANSLSAQSCCLHHWSYQLTWAVRTYDASIHEHVQAANRFVHVPWIFDFQGFPDMQYPHLKRCTSHAQLPVDVPKCWKNHWQSTGSSGRETTRGARDGCVADIVVLTQQKSYSEMVWRCHSLFCEFKWTYVNFSSVQSSTCQIKRIAHVNS